MFQKPFRVKTQTSIKGSDRKRLRADVSKLFPQISSESLLELVPHKDDLSTVKICMHGGQNAVVYCSQKNPIFFDVYGKIYPTVYTLWKHPELLPLFTTWPPVFPKLASGADLMLPGVVVQGEVNLKTFGKMTKGTMCAVKLVGNIAPVAVGETALSGEDMYMSNMRGKGVQIVHILGDHLWDFGDKSNPPELGDDGLVADDTQQNNAQMESNTESACEKDREIPANIDGLNISEGDNAASGDNPIAGDEENGVQNDIDLVAEMDQLLMTCCLCALKTSVKKSNLPLLTSAFFKNHMQAFCATGQTIDVKKSSYKKLSKFLQKIKDKGLIKLKEQSKGVDAIIEVDRTHPDLRDFEVPEIPTEVTNLESVGGKDGEYVPPRITEMFIIPAQLLPIFKGHGHGKGDAVSLPEIRKLITDYVQANSLQDSERKSHIVLDPNLASIVLLKKEGDLGYLTWEDVISRVKEKMPAAFQLEFPGKPPTIKKGKVEAIKLTVEKRAANKKVTIVENLENFGIDPNTLAHTVQKAVSCSTSVTPHHQKTKGLQVLVQGNQIAYIGSLLLDKYKIPKRFVQGLEKAVKNKRR